MYVFIRQDAQWGSLQRLHDGPFKVLERCARVEINGKSEKVSIDRLKPANVDLSSLPVVLGQRGEPCKILRQTSPPTPGIMIRTHSGRPTTPPQQFISVLGGG